MSSACSVTETSVVGAAGVGLESVSHNEDVLFLTPNQDQEEEEEEYEVDVKAGNESLGEDVNNARSLYANNGQISLLADVDDLNEDSEKTTSELQTNVDSKPTESSYLSGDQITADMSGSFDDPNSTKNDESHNSEHQFIPNGHMENITANNAAEIMSGNKTGIDESILTDMKYLFKNTRYFLIKSNNFDNVNLAKQKSVWSTPRVNEIKLNKAYRECANVMLIFSVAESGRFQGLARLSSDCRKDEDLQVNWILPPTLSARSLNGVFKIDWITKNDLFFTKCAYILNPWNENKPVKVGRDGQEIESHAGELLCRQFDLTDINTQPDEKNISIINEHLLTIINRSKQRHEELVNEKERQKNRDRHRRSRERSPRSSDERANSSERSTRTSDSLSITGPYTDHRDSTNYHRKDYQGNHHQQQSFSQKRNYYDVNKKTNYYDRQSHHHRGPNNNFPSNNYNQNYHYNKSNYNQNYQQMQPLHQNGMNSHHTHPQQPFYQLQHDNLMHPMQNMPHYQQNMQQMEMQNYQMYQQRAPHGNQNDTHKKHRNRSSSPKKQRLSDDFLPAAKEIVLKSTTYEEYLANAARMSSSQNNFPNQTADPNGNRMRESSNYGNYDGNYQNRGNFQGSYQFNQSMANSPVNPTVDSTKYEQEVEEFLRRTTGVAPVTNQHKFKEDERLSQTRHSEKKKSSSKEKDRGDYHKHHKHEKRRSSSRERSRRRSKDRK